MLSVQGIDKKFNLKTESETTLYQNLSLDVKEGEFVTIIGSNGSGKSTLLNLICGQVAPDKGSIEFLGRDLLKVKNYKRFEKISRVYQDPVAGTSPSLTVLENLSLALDKGKLFNLNKAVRSDMKSYFVEQLRSLDLGLEEKLDVRVGQLSGGQRQALSLLMSLMNEPEMLLLDEHTAALDPKSSETIMELTQEMVSKRSMTTIMVTHNLQHALDYGSRLLMFHQGRIIADISGDEKKSLVREDLIKLFLENDELFVEVV